MHTRGERVFCPMRTSAWYVAVAGAVSLTANEQLPADAVRHVLPIRVEQPGQAHLSSVWTVLPFAGGQTQPQPNTHTRQLPPLTMPRMSRLAPLPYHQHEAALRPRILSCLSFATCLTGCSRPLLTMINLTSIFFRAIFFSQHNVFLTRIKRIIYI